MMRFAIGTSVTAALVLAAGSTGAQVGAERLRATSIARHGGGGRSGAGL